VQLTNAAAMLKYTTVEPDGRANVNLRSGTVRLWFKPLWNSGVGPGVAAKLIEVGSKGGAQTNGWWSLFVNSTGNSLSFASQTNNTAEATNLTAAISFESNTSKTIQPLVKGMTMKKTLCSVSVTLFFAVGAFGQGTILWDESVNGPLSHDFNNPTSINPLGPGTNSVIGAAEIVPVGNNWETFTDFFLVRVPPNSSITGVFLQIDKPNVWTGLKDPSYSTDFAFSGNSASGELLSQWGIAPVGPGLYGMYVQNSDAQAVASIANYRLDFFLESVPEPGTLPLLFLGLGLVGLRSSKRIQRNPK